MPGPLENHLVLCNNVNAHEKAKSLKNDDAKPMGLKSSKDDQDGQAAEIAKPGKPGGAKPGI